MEDVGGEELEQVGHAATIGEGCVGGGGGGGGVMGRLDLRTIP